MGALAGLLRSQGHVLRGSDGPIYPPMSDQLAELEIPCMEGYSAENLAWGPELVVMGNTCKADNPEYLAAQEAGLKIQSLPQTLASELLGRRHSLVVAGTHGKTTTSSLVAHVFMNAGRDPGVFVGGVPNDLGRGYHLGSGSEFILEGDEYGSACFDPRSKFVHYAPQSAILTSVELDHVDIFASMEEVREAFRTFVDLIPADGLLLVAANSPEAVEISKRCKGQVEQYGVVEDGVSDASVAWQAVGVDELDSGRCHFEVLHYGELFDHFETILMGSYNVANALATIAVAHARGLDRRDIRSGISSYSGVARRQQFRGQAQGVQIMEDYGHHPSAIALTLDGLRRRFRKRRIIAVFEPRTATSRRKTFQREFADAFANADELVVADLYRPEAVPESERFKPSQLALDVHQRGTPATHLGDVSAICEHLVASARPGDVVVVFTTGAFDNIFEKLLSAFGDAVMPAQSRHLESLRALLADLSLDNSDIDKAKIREFLVLENENGLVGCVGMEIMNEDAVLRSLAVAPEGRGIGYGWMLADMAINWARTRGVRRIYLTTEEASEFFAAKHGFRIVDLATVPARVMASTTFANRDDSHVPMRLDL